MGCGSSVYLEEKKNVVIVGGGFAGLQLAKIFEANPKVNVDVTLVSKLDYFDINYATFRSLVEPSMAAKQTIPLKDCLKKTKIVIGAVTSVSKSSVSVIVNGTPEEIVYDVLVLCTGSRYTHESVSFLKGDDMATTTSARIAQLESKAKELSAYKQFYVVGGGASGIEMAGELSDAYPDAKIQLSTRSKFAPGYSATTQAKVTKHFTEKANVDLRPDTSFTAAAPDGSTLVLAGMKPNTEFLADCDFIKLASTGHVMVKEDLYAIDSDVTNVFAFGDIAAPNIMAGPAITCGGFQTMTKVAPGVFKNILNYLKDKPLVKIPKEQTGGLITLGKKNGAGNFGNFNLPSLVVKMVKCPDLFAGKTKKDITRF
jgi:NADH dehydrogenase FAD-containing subunit